MLIHLTLRHRLVLVLLLAFTPVVAHSVFARGQLVSLVWESGQQAALQVARTAVVAHEEAVTETRVTLGVLSQMNAVRANPEVICGDVLPRLSGARRYFTVMGVIDREGWVVCLASGLEAPIYVGDRPYVEEAYRTEEFTVGGYQRGRVTGQASLTLVQPVRNPAGEVTHLLAAGLDLQYLAGAYTGRSESEDLSVTIFDRSGQVLSRDEVGFNEEGVRVDDQLLERALLVDGTDVVGEFYDLDGVSRTFAVVPLRMARPDGLANAFLAVGYDPLFASAGTARILRNNHLGLLIALLIAVGGGWILLERFLLIRLGRLADAAERLGTGDWEARTGFVGESDEVGRLAQAFDKMAMNLQQLNESETQWARREIQEREERFRQLADNIDGVFWLEDPRSGELLYVSPPVERIWGRPAEDFLGTGTGFTDSLHPDDQARVTELFSRDPASTRETEYRIVRPDGSVRWIRDRSFPVPDSHGETARVAGFAEDVTEEKRLAEELQHSQRLEAVGRLAGGIAHDFNNILTTVMGNAQLLMDTLPGDSPEVAEAEEILSGARRAAHLTAQLLAFSRKQLIQPQRTQLNDVVLGMATMLQRAATERVQLELLLAEELPLVWVDPGQMEQILLNLVVNARDAMPDGGRCLVETGLAELDENYAEERPGNVTPGQYVQLVVSDSGVGIPREVLDHIFEPFFTTKPMGEGTGLGLATVYGIVKQAGGFVWAYSEVGHGTAFKVYLPLADSSGPVPSAHPPQRDGSTLSSGLERVLLLEDEASVRAVIRQALTRAGYDVRVAGDLGEVNARLETPGGGEWRPDLFITDVVLPGSVTGPEKARELSQLHPQLRVLFISGYSPQSDTGSRLLDPGIPFLQKPFTSEQLRNAARRALDGPPPEWA